MALVPVSADGSHIGVGVIYNLPRANDRLMTDHIISCVDSNNKSAQSNLGRGPRRGSCARRWLA